MAGERSDTLCRWQPGRITEPGTFVELLEQHGANRLVLALDVNFERGTPVVATHGWTRSSGAELWDCIESFLPSGLKHLLCTDISRDGAMAGPNLELYAEILRRFPGIRLQASGGVRAIGDLAALAEIGVPAAITGKALLEGKLAPMEVRTFLQSA